MKPVIMRKLAHLRPHTRQKGAVLILLGLALAVLIGFLGIVIDLGRLFVTKTEVQSAMDACALAAAAELKPDVVPVDAEAITRAVNAGITAGTRNKVNLQSEAIEITAVDIYFSDHLSNNSTTFPFGYVQSAVANPATSRYVLCTHSETGISTWFMQVLEQFLEEAAEANSVGAWATATLMPSQITCALPIGLCKAPAGSASDPHAGMTVGAWFTSKLSSGATGSYDWIDFTPPNGGANELADIIKGTGTCSVPGAGTMVGEQGNKESLDKAWNTRFGLYKGSDNSTNAPPDYTGYGYTPTNWPSKFNAFGGTSPGILNFQTARSQYRAYQGTPGNGYSSSNDHATKGADRRLATVPIVDCSAWAASNPQTQPILGYACVLLLHPMTHKSDPLYSEETWLEYRGSSSDPNSPCNTSGLGGGTAGPLVPVLVH